MGYLLEQLRLPVMRLDLGGNRIQSHTEAPHKLPRVRQPINFRSGSEVGRIGSRRTRKLAEQRLSIDARELPVQSPHEYRQLLAKGTGRCRLAVGAGEHRGFGIFLGKFCKLGP